MEGTKPLPTECFALKKFSLISGVISKDAAADKTSDQEIMEHTSNNNNKLSSSNSKNNCYSITPSLRGISMN